MLLTFAEILECATNPLFGVKLDGKVIIPAECPNCGSLLMTKNRATVNDTIVAHYRCGSVYRFPASGAPPTSRRSKTCKANTQVNTL